MKRIIILDRDGVLNKMVVDPEHGLIDSPMNIDQVQIFDGVADNLLRLQNAGYLLAVATNQPAAAKGKTTIANLQAVQNLVVQKCEASGAKFMSVQVCFHRSEDHCPCRKPKPGMLNAILALGDIDKTQSWMVGDGVTDIQAGSVAGIKTAFCGAKKTDAITLFSERELRPDFWGKDLAEFTDALLGGRV